MEDSLAFQLYGKLQKVLQRRCDVNLITFCACCWARSMLVDGVKEVGLDSMYSMYMGGFIITISPR